MPPPAPMPTIRLLDDQVINKIAAGEVVERPASVVKELIENALDAGAVRIDVEVVDGGRKLIRVTDNGSGMTRDQALLAIERHATSKIRDIADIDRITSMGFRGEALSAIPSVSRFTLRSRADGENGGTEVLINGGTIMDVQDTGCPVGTIMEVRNLFFNVPARRKFLRTNQTETGHIRQLMHTYALAFPAVAWTLTVDDRTDISLPAGSGLEERLHQLFDRTLTAALKTVKYASGDLSVSGFAALPTCHRADRSGQYIFVNKRPASAPLVGYAIQQAYESLLPKGRQAVVFLFLDLPPGLVDVNVHPTKKEVRFRNPGEMRDTITAALRQALGREITPESHQPANPFALTPEKAHPYRPQPRPLTFSYPQTPPATPALPPHAPAPKQANPPPTPDPWDEQPGGEESLWGAYQVMGLAGNRYVVIETAAGIVLLDPQAAHERIIFERLMKGLEQHKPRSQRLLAPETVTLPPAEARLVRKHLELLGELGFGLAEFGGETLLVDALPACFDKLSAYTVLSEMAADLERGGPRSGGKKWTAEMIARAACRSATWGGHALSMPEIRALVKDLSAAEMPYTCPHGRPTVIFMSFTELDKKFGK